MSPPKAPESAEATDNCQVLDIVQLQEDLLKR